MVKNKGTMYIGIILFLFGILGIMSFLVNAISLSMDSPYLILGIAYLGSLLVGMAIVLQANRGRLP